MRQISSDFAPPLRLIAPYFRAGAWFYLLSMVALLFIGPNFSHQSFEIAGWVHLFILGFVMVSIFGAMAQLVPVVLEVGHALVESYYLILPILLSGIAMMVLGFWVAPAMLSYGGLLVLVAMLIFGFENFATLKKSSQKSFTAKTVRFGTLFLLAGIGFGFVLTMALSGLVSLDIQPLLRAHLYLVIVGYLFVTIVGLSLILIPMFSLAHGFKQWAIEQSFNLFVVSVVLATLSTLIDRVWLFELGVGVGVVAVALYSYQMAIIARMTVRKELDIWARSMVAAFVSMVGSVVMMVCYLINSDERYLYGGFVLFLFGFVGNMITGHLYKIVPFLVWFERFSPLVGKEPVPMLHQMYSKQGSALFFAFANSGALMLIVAIFLKSSLLMQAGGSFLVGGGLFLMLTLNNMLAYGQKGER